MEKETRVKYVMLIMDTPNEPAPDSPEYGAWYAEVGAWYEKWGATGRLEGGYQLQGPATAKTVRSTGVTDGPYIETKEVLGGFSTIEADTIDEAADIIWATVIAGLVVVTMGFILRSKATSGVPGKFQLLARRESLKTLNSQEHGCHGRRKTHGLGHFWRRFQFGRQPARIRGNHPGQL